MIKQIAMAAAFAACGLLLAGCEKPKPVVAAKKPPAADYQMAATVAPPPAAQIRAICFNDADLAVFRVRMLIQELQVGVLQCQGAGGVRLLERQYTDFLNKTSAERNDNGRQLTTVLGRKRRNVDVTVTEIANRTAQRASTDPEFCGRMIRAFEWSLSGQVVSLSQVPAPYDIGPEMDVHSCPAP
jgi:hypothetical protein